MNIVTKFTIATDQGVETLSMLTKKLAFEKYGSLVSESLLDEYVSVNFHRKALIDEMNSLSNQWLVVYVANNPAGYARITTRGRKPAALEGKRAVRVADFGVLKSYPDPAITDSLLQKCLAVCQSQPGVHTWVNEHDESLLIQLLENKGFIKCEGNFELDELPLPSVCLIR